MYPRQQLDVFLEANPELSQEEAANPERLVRRGFKAGNKTVVYFRKRRKDHSTHSFQLQDLMKKILLKVKPFITMGNSLPQLWAAVFKM